MKFSVRTLEIRELFWHDNVHKFLFEVNKKSWELIYLSEDHKPSHEAERKRILKCGGRVHTFKGEKGENLGPLRVWLPNQST